MLICAAESGNLEVVKSLLENGADVNARDNVGQNGPHDGYRA